MKIKLLLFIPLLFCFAAVRAQYTQVNHPTGTVNYGGTNVTVTANGTGALIYGNWCGAGDYWIGANSQAGGFTYDFQPGVTGVRFEFTAMNFDEVLSVSVNGQPYVLGDCNLTDFPGTCGTYNTVVTNGNVTCPVDVSSGANGTITVCGNITSITLSNIAAGNGSVFSTYFTTSTCDLGGGGSVTAGSNGPLCQGEDLNLTATSGGLTYSWTGPNGFTSNQQNPTITGVTAGMSGDYIVTSSGACGTASDTITVQVTPGPVIGSMGSNSPVCEGQTLSLTTGAVTGAVYNWSGPNGFVSGMQLPTIPNVTLAAAGDYYLTVSVNNCVSDPDTITVSIEPLPALPVVADVNYCEGDVAVPLTAQGTNLTWYYVPTGGTPIPGGAPTPNTSTAGTITYYVSSTGPGPTNCEGPRAPLTVTVYTHPNPPQIAYKNSYCANETFEPFVVVSGQNVLYYTQATGGVGDPTAPVVDPAIPGTYQWFASQTVNGCESDRLPINIIVHPFIQASFTYDILWGCAEDSVQFTNTSTGAFGYTWSFGDGQSETTTSPLHVYEDQDVYTVRLISTAPYCRDTVEEVIDLN
ncbi:MAG: hypothetical protein JNL72_10300, partial [Flavipsychrobacter sp.]|nr:hypothetical protein [Flavipsychrobacter sp.]